MQQSVGYFILTLAVELFPFQKLTQFSIERYWRHGRHVSSGYLEPLLKSSETVAVNLDEDIDVHTERNSVVSGLIDNAIIYLRNLCKVHPILG